MVLSEAGMAGAVLSWVDETVGEKWDLFLDVGVGQTQDKTQQTRHGLWWDLGLGMGEAGESGVQAAVVLMLAAVAGGPDAQLGETTPRREIQDPDGLWVDGVMSVSPGWVGMALGSVP